jgi:3-oxoacyl-[acyl-carrier protein] reductase
MRLANKVAIITGAGSGMGRASAYLFSKEGATVVVADINEVGSKETVDTIKNSGGKAISVHTNVSIASEVEHLIGLTMNTFGQIDILFNLAGIPVPAVKVEDTDESLWDKAFAVHVKGIFLAAKYSVPYMKKAGGGVIINIASMAAVRVPAKSCAYSSSKGAAITLTKALAIELASSKIRVNCINPTLTDTPFIQGANIETRNRIMSTIPLGCIARPEDIANAALFLACDESSMLTGTCMNVDGGTSI